jgi:hypothetical protein
VDSSTRAEDWAVARRLGINWRIELRREIERARKGDYLIELSPDLLEAMLDYYESGGFSTRETT